MRLDAERVRGNSRGDEPRARYLEGHIADVQPAEDLVLETLVKHVDVVARRELPLGVIVHVDVDSLRENAAGADGQLLSNAWRGKPGAASRHWIGKIERRAVLVFQAIE